VVILLWGLESDEPLAMVHEALQDLGAEALLLDQRRALETQLQLKDGRTLAGSIRYGSRSLDLDQITSCYLRPYDTRRIPAIQSLEVTEFCERHKHVVYKSISGVRSRVARLDANARQRVADVAHCPTQFQAYIPGRDYRVHVVGEQVFACEVRSQADDYRYGPDNTSLSICATRLPREIEERAVVMTKAMALEVGGIDLRRTSQDEWYCFEVNPSPGFSFYEQFSGQGVANAIARLLAAPKSGRSSLEHALPLRKGGTQSGAMKRLQIGRTELSWETR
jgi:ribosomal protein S6-L-glutamate ligase RimK-like protein